ncbi:MAG: hypothetical protein ACPGYT_11920 [Nitrospirales bacterium]
MGKRGPIRFAGVVDWAKSRRIANTADREIVVMIKVPIMFKKSVDAMTDIEGGIEFSVQEQ